MRIIFKKNVVSEAVSYALCAVSNQRTISAIQGILVETIGQNKCCFSSFDLEKGVRVVIEAQIEEPGSCIIDAQRLGQIIKIMPENTITLSLKNDVAVLESGKSEFEVFAQGKEAFPSLPDLDTNIGFTMKQKDLYSMISQTLFAVSQSLQRPVFTGELVRIENNSISVVGCDGYRMAVKEKECDLSDATPNISTKVIVPGKTLSELMKMIGDVDEEIEIKASTKHIIFEIKEKELMFFSRLLEGDYIDYERLIPKQFNTFVYVYTDVMISSLERASLVSEENTTAGSKSFVKLSVTDGRCEISSVSSKGKVKDEIPIEKEGADIDIGFSCKYLIDALKACKSEKVKISLASPLISMVMEPDDAEKEASEKLTMLILPIKLK